jgi:hypothetical protein
MPKRRQYSRKKVGGADFLDSTEGLNDAFALVQSHIARNDPQTKVNSWVNMSSMERKNQKTVRHTKQQAMLKSAQLLSPTTQQRQSKMAMLSPISITSMGDMRTQREVRSAEIRQKLRNVFIERASKHGSIKNLYRVLDAEKQGGISLSAFRRAFEKLG